MGHSRTRRVWCNDEAILSRSWCVKIYIKENEEIFSIIDNFEKINSKKDLTKKSNLLSFSNKKKKNQTQFIYENSSSNKNYKIDNCTYIINNENNQNINNIPSKEIYRNNILGKLQKKNFDILKKSQEKKVKI